MKQLKLFLPYLFLFFLTTSWPFIHYPLTDGDALHWLPIAKEISKTLNFFSYSQVDQSHGPLLVWGSGAIVHFLPSSSYAYSLFTILVSCLGLFLMYFFSYRFWKDAHISCLAVFLQSICLAYIYLSRTPMYDLSAAIFYFGFVGFYVLHLREKHLKYLLLAIIFAAIGSLSRFSIVLGLSGIFMIISGIIYHQKWWKIIVHLGFLVSCSVLFCMPWLIGQSAVHGQNFLQIFLIDNISRFIKEPDITAKTYRDFYTFPLYAFLGLLPFSSLASATFFRKGIIQRLRNNKIYLVIFAAFIPCLVLFSLSGHVKLGRYIAYVFLPMILFLAHSFYTIDLEDNQWKKITSRINLATLLFLGIGFIALIVNFNQQAHEGLLFSVALIALIFTSVFCMNWVVQHRVKWLKQASIPLLGLFCALYIGFYTVTTYESYHSTFLSSIRISAEAIIHEK